MRTRPPQIIIASAAFSRPARSSWNAASSIVTSPCLPRSDRGRDESARILKPEAKSMRNALISASRPARRCRGTPSRAPRRRRANTRAPTSRSRRCTRAPCPRCSRCRGRPCRRRRRPSSRSASSSRRRVHDAPMRRDLRHTATSAWSATHACWYESSTCGALASDLTFSAPVASPGRGAFGFAVDARLRLRKYAPGGRRGSYASPRSIALRISALERRSHHCTR
jgi:hypothetical protein